MLRIRSRESGGYSYVFAQGPSEVKLTTPQRWQGVEGEPATGTAGKRWTSKQRHSTLPFENPFD